MRVPFTIRHNREMASNETTIDQARRHVAEAERVVAEQVERVRRMHSHGQDATEAERLLATFEHILATMRDHLQYEENRK